MNELPAGDPLDEATRRRIAALVDPPTVSDWVDVQRRAHGKGRRDGGHRGGLAVVAGLAGLGLAVAALLVLAPGRGAPLPAAAPPFTMIPPASPDDVPEGVRGRLGLSRSAPAVRLATFDTPYGRYRVWRIVNDGKQYFGRYLDVMSRGARETGAGTSCAPRIGGVFPADPPGSLERVTVPDVVGVRIAQARQSITAAGLRVGPITSTTGRLLQTPDPRFVVISVDDVTPAAPATPIGLTVGPPGSATRPADPSGVVTCGGFSEGPDGLTTEVHTTSNVTALEFGWTDGATSTVPVENGISMLVFPFENCRRDLPTRLTLRDTAGRAIASPEARRVMRPSEGPLRPSFDPIRCRPPVGTQDGTFTGLTRAPAFTGAPPPGPAFDLDWSTARVAIATEAIPRYGTIRVFIGESSLGVPGVCVGAVAESGSLNNGVSVGCASTRAAVTGLLFIPLDGARPGDPFVTVGIVPDGITAVRFGGRTNAVTNNAWIAEGRPSGSLTLVNADGSEVEVRTQR